jgi:hypothetical protein
VKAFGTVLVQSSHFEVDWIGAKLESKSASSPGRALTVLEIGALSDLDDVAVRIADVAANLAVLGNRFR